MDKPLSQCMSEFASQVFILRRRSAEGGGQIEVPVIPAVTLPPVGVSMYIAHCSRQGRLPTPRRSQVTHRHARVCACSHETKTRLEPAKYHLS
jgi:hypothetical protein